MWIRHTHTLPRKEKNAKKFLISQQSVLLPLPFHNGRNVSFHKINNIYIGFLNKFLSIRKHALCETPPLTTLFYFYSSSSSSSASFTAAAPSRRFASFHRKYLPFHLNMYAWMCVRSQFTFHSLVTWKILLEKLFISSTWIDGNRCEHTFLCRHASCERVNAVRPKRFLLVYSHFRHSE